MNFLRKLVNCFLQRGKTKMEQALLEQPDIIFELAKKYINKDYSINIELPEEFSKIIIAASGSSYNSGAIAAEFMRNKLKMNVQTFYASEIAISNEFDTDKDALYIFVSQSGETADTNAAFNKISRITDKTFAVVNTKNSKLYNSAKYKMLTYAGAEKSVVSVKTMTSQLYCLFLTALKAAKLDKTNYMKYIEQFINVPEYIKTGIAARSRIKECAKVLSEYDSASIAGSGMFYYAAAEGALKIKETSYINISVYPSGEFLHGHAAILNKKCAFIMLVNDSNINTAVEVLMQINNHYKTEVIIISSAQIKDADKHDFIHIETENDVSFLFAALAVFQLLALETAAVSNNNPDKPKGLVKIVK